LVIDFTLSHLTVVRCMTMLEAKTAAGHKICTHGCCGVEQWRNLALRVLGLLTLRVGAAPIEVRA
jgi:hypothetical protein